MKGTLRSRRQFTEVYDSGLKAVGRHVVAFALSTSESESPRLETGPRGVAVGIVASRKVGNAVARNRAKRVLRVAYAALHPRLTAYTHLVLVARRSIIEDRVRSDELRDELEALLGGLGLLTEERR